jgi:hypothetical protein
MPRRAASADPLGQVLMPTRNARSMVALRERSWRRCQQIAAATPLASARQHGYKNSTSPTWWRAPGSRTGQRPACT